MYTVTALHLARACNWGQEAPHVDQEKHKRKPHQPVLTSVQCPIAKLRGSHRSVPQEAPGWMSQQCLTHPHRQHPQPGTMSSEPHPVSSDYRTQLPTETVLVGTVTAAKCKTEMARERMAPAASRERLRSQNIPPRHSAWQQPSLSHLTQQDQEWGGYWETPPNRWSLTSTQHAIYCTGCISSYTVSYYRSFPFP